MFTSRHAQLKLTTFDVRPPSAAGGYFALFYGCARILLAGIEVMHMIRKGQLGDIKDRASSAANQFYSLAF